MSVSEVLHKHQYYWKLGSMHFVELTRLVDRVVCREFWRKSTPKFECQLVVSYLEIWL